MTECDDVGSGTEGFDRGEGRKVGGAQSQEQGKPPLYRRSVNASR